MMITKANVYQTPFLCCIGNGHGDCNYVVPNVDTCKSSRCSGKYKLE